MSLKGSIPVRFHDTAASCCHGLDGEFLAKARTSKRGTENAFRGLVDDRHVRGSSTALWFASRTTTSLRMTAQDMPRRMVSASWVNSGSARPWVFLPAQLLPLTDRPRCWLGSALLPECIARIPGSGAAFLPCAPAFAG